MNNKLAASLSGVCVASAVVIGSVLAVANHHDPAPAKPAGHTVIPTVTVLATVTATASPTPVAVAKVKPSTKPAAPKKQAVIRQGAPVTDPTPADTSATTYADQPATHGHHPRNGPSDAPTSWQGGAPDDTETPVTHSP